MVKQNDYNLTGGARGENLFGRTWDVSATHGKNRAETLLTDSVNPTYGLASPRSFCNGAFVASETTGDVDLTRDFETGLFAAPLASRWGSRSDAIDTASRRVKSRPMRTVASRC